MRYMNKKIDKSYKDYVEDYLNKHNYTNRS